MLVRCVGFLSTYVVRLRYVNFYLAATVHAMMLCCVQSGQTALYWAAHEGYDNIVQILIDYSTAVDIGWDEVTTDVCFIHLSLACMGTQR